MAGNHGTGLAALVLALSSYGTLHGGCAAEHTESDGRIDPRGRRDASFDEGDAALDDEQDEQDSDLDEASDAAASARDADGERDASASGRGEDDADGEHPAGGEAPAKDAAAAEPGSSDDGQRADAAAERPADGSSTSGCSVGPVPEAVRARLNLGDFYKKYADADGLAILASDKPVDRTLTLACQLVNEMVGEREDVRDALIRNKARFVIIGSSEQTTDPPEFSHLPEYYNTRARGLGGQVGMCAEESILCDRSKDRWRGESICVHEFAHTISIYGLYAADKTFESRLTATYREATGKGLWSNTYAGEQPQEYWAEGVQNWYETNLESARPNGVHGPINTKDELRDYDRKLYDLIGELLPDEVAWEDCYRRR